MDLERREVLLTLIKGVCLKKFKDYCARGIRV